ncbi:MAG: porin [Bradyrhizobium sp.]|nr:porin [Bradyrhizobium sp.]
MNMVKSLILGSAAGLLAMGGAQAADLPVKAKAVEYVKICSLYGAGFFYIPGTDTCIKLGGYLRVDTTFNGGIYDAPGYAGDLGQQNRYRDYFAARSRLALTVDTRTATEYGVVRTFGQGDFQFSTLGSSRNPNVLNTSLLTTTAGTQIGGGLVANNANLLDTPGGGYVAVEMVFIQFAGFTFGKSASAFATPWHGYPGNNTSFLLGGHDTVTGVNNIQYTAQFGNGVSATIGLDDPTVFHRTAVYNLATPLNTNIAVQPGGTPATAFLGAQGTSANAYAGVHAPAIVGNIRVDQAWGLFQISAAANEVNGSYNSLGLSGLPAVGVGGVVPFGPSEPSGHPDSKWGWSVMGALQIKNIPTGAGDDIKIDATYASGMTKQVISTSGASPNFAMFSGSGRAGAYQSIGFGVTTDGMYLPVFAGGDGRIHLTESYGIRGAFNHNWDPYWSTSLFGSATAVRYDGTTKAVYCGIYTASAATGGPGGKSADFSCNPDFNTYQLGVVTRWTPVKNLTFSAEVQWFRLDQKYTGTSFMANMPPKPQTSYEYKDQDTVSLNVRVQRNF